MNVDSKEYKELVKKVLSNRLTLPTLSPLKINKKEDFQLEDTWDIFHHIGWPVGRMTDYVNYDNGDEFIPLSKAPKSFLNKYYNMNLGNEIDLEIVFGENRDKIWKRKIKSETGLTPYQLLEEVMKLYNTKLSGREKIYDLEGNFINNIFKGRLPLEMITFQASLSGFEKHGNSYRIVFDYY